MMKLDLLLSTGNASEIWLKCIFRGGSLAIPLSGNYKSELGLLVSQTNINRLVMTSSMMVQRILNCWLI